VKPEEIEADRLAAAHETAFEMLLSTGYTGPEELNAHAAIALAYELRALRAALRKDEPVYYLSEKQ
jgi:hypothetical protein